MKYFLIILISINLLFPWFDEMNETYQDHLITHQHNWPDQKDDIHFKFGPDFEGFKKWNRTYLGFPDRPIVIDIQYDLNILQCRIDSLGLIKNLIPTWILLLIFFVRNLKKKKSM